VRQIADDAQRLKFIEDTDLWAWHDSLDGGRPFEEAARELSEVYPLMADLISAWGSRFGETISGPIEPVTRLSRSWTRPGCRCSRSPISPPISGRRCREGAAFFSRFRRIVVSGEEKLLKPDPAIYWLALDRFGLKPADCFVRRRPPDQRGGRRSDRAAPAHLFTDAVALREQLVADGLLPPRP
jgi:2-haloacid dehalogenase